MVAFVTLQEVKRGLLIDFDDDDELLNDYILGASGVIKNYLKDTADNYKNDDGEVDLTKVPAEVKTATKLLINIFYREPDGDSGGLFKDETLPDVVTALIRPLRNPSLA